MFRNSVSESNMIYRINPRKVVSKIVIHSFSNDIKHTTRYRKVMKLFFQNVFTNLKKWILCSTVVLNIQYFSSKIKNI